MKSRRFHIALTLLVIVVLAPAEDKPKPILGSAQGTLFDSASGRPISHATLSLKPLGRGDADLLAITAGSDAEGLFEFPEVPPGQYLLTATKPGFLDALYGAKFLGDIGIPITITAGQGVTGLSFSLTPGVVIAGSVQNEDGEPVPNAIVRALQYKYFHHGKRLAAADSTTANDHGDFRLHNLLPGRYYLVVVTNKPRVLKENGKSVEGRYPPTYYPSTATFEKAVSLSLRPGEEAIANINITAARSYTVRGRIAGVDPAPPAGLEIMSKAAVGAAPAGVKVSATNTFEIKGLLPGSYRLVARGVSSGRPAHGVQNFTIEESDLNDVMIDVGKAALPVSGNVFLPRGVNRNDVRVTVRLEVAISDDDEDNDLPPPATGNGNVTAGDGVGSFADLTAERYSRVMFPTVLVSGPGAQNLYISSVRFNWEDVTNSGFDPTESGTLSIHLENRGGEISGSALGRDGQRFPGASICLYPDEKRQLRPDLYHLVRTDQNGEFTITGIAPGTYNLAAFDHVETDAATDPDFLKQYAHETRSLEVVYRTNYNLSLTVVTADPEKKYAAAQ